MKPGDISHALEDFQIYTGENGAIRNTSPAITLPNIAPSQGVVSISPVVTANCPPPLLQPPVFISTGIYWLGESSQVWLWPVMLHTVRRWQGGCERHAPERGWRGFCPPAAQLKGDDGRWVTVCSPGCMQGSPRTQIAKEGGKLYALVAQRG